MLAGQEGFPQPADTSDILQFQLLLHKIYMIPTFIIWPHFGVSEILELKITFYCQMFI